MASTLRFDKWENTLGQPYGTVLQVVQSVKSDTMAVAMSAQTGTPTIANTVFLMSATILPKINNSKILVTSSIKYSSAGSTASLVLFRDSTPIGIGDLAGNRRRSTTGTGLQIDANQISGIGDISFLDSPNTSSNVTYSVRFWSDSTNTTYVNRSATDTDGSTGVRTISTITLMEIAQ